MARKTLKVENLEMSTLGCGNELNSNDKFCTKCGKHI